MPDRRQPQATATDPPWPFPGLEPRAYTVVVIDVAWGWETWSAKGDGKSPTRQYHTMTMDEAAALPVLSLLVPGCGVVFAWGTWPLFNRQLRIFEGWGLTYKTGGGWAKSTNTGRLRWGPGHILRTVHEPFAILTTGQTGPAGPRIKNLIEGMGGKVSAGLAREHSRKPDEFYAMIDILVPVGRRVDVFGRQPRQGWEVWGDQADKFAGGA